MMTRNREETISEMRPLIFCDFDGTITNVDVTDEILTQLAHPSWREVEQAWVQGLIGSRECLERQMALVETTQKEMNVLSDGFDYAVRRVLSHAGVDGELRNGSHVFTSALHFKGRRWAVSFPNSS